MVGQTWEHSKATDQVAKTINRLVKTPQRKTHGERFINWIRREIAFYLLRKEKRWLRKQ